MALVPATINLNWISNYNGPHRVCYRVVGAPTYICTVPGTPGPGFHPLCGGGGAPCSYAIDILVDNETCDQVDYEGYIQAACEDELSVVGRDPFAISFIPDPACNRYNVTCGAVALDDGTVTAPGAGYVIGVYPLPLVGGGGGIGGTAEAVVTGTRAVTGYLGDGLGAGYPNIGLHPNAATDNISASGVGLEFNAEVEPAGTLIVSSIASGGSGYFTGDTVQVAQVIVGNPITIETFTLTADDTGTVTDINILTPGSGYTTPPVPDFSGFAPGAGAAGTIALAPCGALTVYDCSGVSAVIHPGLALGEDTQMCGSAVPTVPTGYSAVEDGNCLCNCVTTDVGNSGPSDEVTYYYIDCNGDAQTGTLTTGVYLGDTCMVDGSLETTVTGAAVADITVGAACDGV